MEPIAVILLIFATTIGLGEELKSQKQEIEQVDSSFLRLAGSHAATSARDLVNHEDQEAEIKRLSKEIQLLNNRLTEHIHKIN